MMTMTNPTEPLTRDLVDDLTDATQAAFNRLNQAIGDRTTNDTEQTALDRLIAANHALGRLAITIPVPPSLLKVLRAAGLDAKPHGMDAAAVTFDDDRYVIVAPTAAGAHRVELWHPGEVDPEHETTVASAQAAAGAVEVYRSLP